MRVRLRSLRDPVGVRSPGGPRAPLSPIKVEGGEWGESARSPARLISSCPSYGPREQHGVNELATRQGPRDPLSYASERASAGE